MPDENQNGIPDSWDRPLGALLTLAGIVFAGLAYKLEPCPWWVAFAAGLTTAVGGAFKIGVVPPRWPSSTVLALGLAGAVAAGGAGCTDPLWRAGAGVQSAGNLTDKAVAAASKHDREACKAKHKAKTPEFRACYKGSDGYKALRAWRDTALRAFNTVLASYVTTLTLIEQSRGKKPDLAMAFGMLRPAACAVERVINQWKHKLGATATVILGITRTFTGGSCK